MELTCPACGQPFKGKAQPLVAAVKGHLRAHPECAKKIRPGVLTCAKCLRPFGRNRQRIQRGRICGQCADASRIPRKVRVMSGGLPTLGKSSH